MVVTRQRRDNTVSSVVSRVAPALRPATNQKAVLGKKVKIKKKFLDEYHLEKF